HMSTADAEKCAYANCKNPDVDGDSITDYQEVYGYTVKVITGWDNTGTPISEERNMHGDPLSAYKQPSGAWTDTDMDSIPDIVEIYFSNITNIDNNTTWEQMCQRYSGLANYQWCREYYWSINGSDPSKAENWTQKAFNPFVVCNLPPMIVRFAISWCSLGGLNPEYYIYAELKAFDLSAVREVKYELYDLCWNKKVATETSTFTEDYTCVSTSKVFRNLDWWTYQFYGYKVVGTVKNGAGFTVSIEGKVMGAIAGFANYIASGINALLGMLTGGLQSVWNKVAKGVEVIVEWVTKNAKEDLMPISELMREKIKGYVEKWAKFIPHCFEEIEKTAYQIEKEIIEMFGIFTRDVIKWANLGRVYGMREVTIGFAEVLRDCMLKMYSWTGIANLQPKVGEQDALQVWNFLQRNVDITSLDSWREFGVRIGRELTGESTSVKMGADTPKGNEYKFGIVIGEWIDGDANGESVVRHDVGKFYNLLTSHGYTMIEIPGKPQNLQLTKEEINLTFVYLRENLTAHPDARVFIAFSGHGIEYPDGDAAYGMSEGPDYFWHDMSDRFDRTILDRNNDSKISNDEMQKPPYSALIMIFSTCHSEYAVENFSRNDTGAEKRVLISSCSKHEKSAAYSFFGIGFGLFPSHFSNKIMGECGEEFLIVFFQVAISFGLFIGGPLGLLLCIIINTVFAFLPLLIPLLVALIAAYDVGLHPASTIYDSTVYASKWTYFGLFFGLIGGSNPKIFNEKLAMEVMV
ncbi:MAG: hypothetical protein ACP5LE_08020, partial [Thermoplasmata archaeon]